MIEESVEDGWGSMGTKVLQSFKKFI